MLEITTRKPLNRSARRLAFILLAAAILIPGQVFARMREVIDACVVFVDGRPLTIHGEQEDLAATPDHPELSPDGPPKIWFRRAGKEYITDDAKIVEYIAWRYNVPAGAESSGYPQAGRFCETNNYAIPFDASYSFAVASPSYNPSYPESGMSIQGQIVRESVNNSTSTWGTPSSTACSPWSRSGEPFSATRSVHGPYGLTPFQRGRVLRML